MILITELLYGAHMKGHTTVVFKENLNKNTHTSTKNINQWLVKTVRCPYRANNGIGYLSANVTSVYVISQFFVCYSLFPLYAYAFHLLVHCFFFSLCICSKIHFDQFIDFNLTFDKSFNKTFN